MGWNGSNNGSGAVGSGKVGASVPLARKAAPSFKKGIIAGLVVVVGAGLAAFIIGRGGSPSRPQEKKAAKGLIEEVKPQIVTQAVQAVESEDQETPGAKGSSDEGSQMGSNAKNVGRYTPVPTGRVMTLMDGTVVTNQTKALFKRPFENVLAAALRPTGTGRTLLMTLRHRYSDAELMRMLQEMTVPEEGDSEGVRQRKLEVQQLKEDILLEVSNGRSLDAVFDGIAQQHSLDQMVRVQTMQMQAEAIRSGDEEAVRAANAAANKIREEKGLEPLALPEVLRDPEEDDWQLNY